MLVKLSKTWMPWVGERAQVQNQTGQKSEEMLGRRSVRPKSKHLKQASSAVHRPVSEGLMAYKGARYQVKPSATSRCTLRRDPEGGGRSGEDTGAASE